MNRSVLTRTAIAGVAVAALALTGCSSDNSPDTNPSSASTSAGPDYANLSGSITGSGSSFQNALQQAAIAAFGDVASDVEITYNSVGSGTGKKDFGAGTTEFGGTDSLVKSGDGPADGSYFYLPIAAAPITVSYHLSGVSSLKLSADTIAKIFTRQITTWNDPAIAADGNTGLPSTPITVVHRTDGSGTTSNFSKYLAAASPSIFTLTPGDTVSWPADTQGGQGNGGVAQVITQTDGTIGYVDFADAKKANLSFASVKNKDGQFVAPSLAGASAAVGNSTIADDLTFAPYTNVAGADTYPITSPTYVLLRPTYSDAAKGAAVKGYFTWLLTDGKSVYEPNNYAFLPDALVQKALAKIDSIKAS